MTANWRATNNRVIKILDAARIGSAFDTAYKALVVEEILAGEDPLQEEFLEQITGSERNLAKGLIRIGRGPLLKNLASVRKFLLIEKLVAFL